MKTDKEIIASCVGKTVVRFVFIEGKDEAELQFLDKTRLRFWHNQDCCESVVLEEIYGDSKDLLFTPLIVSELVLTGSGDGPAFNTQWDEHPREHPEPGVDSESWTDSWYKFRTQKGDVTLRFRGVSNGYYSERVDVDLSPMKFTDEDLVWWDEMIERNFTGRLENIK